MLTHERLKEVLEYDPETGHFVARVTRSNLLKGARAGKRSGKYSRIRIDGRLYYTHKLAWFYMHGKWPDAQIDHINLVPSDNRISNLREATHAQNNFNHSRQRNNKSGKKGVQFAKHSGRWRARIYKDSRPIHLGCFATAEEAHAAYVAAARIHHGEFARAE